MSTASHSSSRRTLLVPVLMIGVGIGWLLTSLGVVPHVDWAWSIGLAAVGVIAFAISGVDKMTVVVGPLFLIASVLSVLRQAGQLAVNVEIPILVIVAGALMLLARASRVPVPSWIVQDDAA